jgi:hypothetical protein
VLQTLTAITEGQAQCCWQWLARSFAFDNAVLKTTHRNKSVVLQAGRYAADPVETFFSSTVEKHVVPTCVLNATVAYAAAAAVFAHHRMGSFNFYSRVCATPILACIYLQSTQLPHH